MPGGWWVGSGQREEGGPVTQELTTAIVDLREDDALAIVDRLLAEGVDPVGILDDCKRAMDVIGERFACGEAFIPELIMAGEIVQTISGKVKPHLTGAPIADKLGVIVLGTVEGDIHDIGKDIVATLLDGFRRPVKVLEVCERLVPLAIDWGVRAADVNRHPMVFIPLHKGADGFLSDEDFRTFYWPTLKKVLLGLIEQGIVPLLFAEGGYNERLAAIHDPEISAGA
jgi:hypothetical protein